MLCKICQRHGHIRLPLEITGLEYRGPEFAFKLHGYEILNRDFQEFDLLLHESGEVREQIRESNLPLDHLAVDGNFLWVVMEWNRRLERRGHATTTSFHKFWHKRRSAPVPSDFLEALDSIYEVGIHPESPTAKRLN